MDTLFWVFELFKIARTAVVDNVKASLAGGENGEPLWKIYGMV